MTITREATHTFAKSKIAASLGAALLLGCSGATSPELPPDEASSSGMTSRESNRTPSEEAKRPRVVGYLPIGRLGSAQLHLETLTHLIIAFANPTDNKVGFRDADPAKIHQVVDAAHTAGVKVLVALAGGADQSETKDALQNGFADYLASVIGLVDTYDLDGVDVDIEGDAIVPDTYERLMVALAKELRKGTEPKLLTAAVGSWRMENYRALGTVDFLSVMSYDHCPSSTHECEHATYDQAVKDLGNWVNIRQMDEHGHPRTIRAEDVVLGVPFYGRCWGESCPGGEPLPDGSFATNLTYRDIVKRCANGLFAGCSRAEDVLTDGKGASGYYVSLNSPETILKKTGLAEDHGGLMIWELGQDSLDGALFAEVQQGFSK